MTRTELLRTTETERLVLRVRTVKIKAENIFGYASRPEVYPAGFPPVKTLKMRFIT